MAGLTELQHLHHAPSRATVPGSYAQPCHKKPVHLLKSNGLHQGHCILQSPNLAVEIFIRRSHTMHPRVGWVAESMYST